MTAHTRRTESSWQLGLGLGLVAVACSLTVPSEDEISGQYSDDASGAGGTTGGGSANSGGQSGANAGASGGSDPGGGGAPLGGAPGSAGDAGAGGDTGGAGGDGPIVFPPAELMIHYTFDDVSTFVAEDATGNGKDGTLTGLSLPMGAPGRIDGGIRLEAAEEQYVQLPGDILAGLDSVSVSSWLNLQTATVWDRLFDFNAGEAVWFYFSPTGWNFDTEDVGTHVAVRNGVVIDPEIQLTETIPTSAWHHIAVILAPPYLRYYRDGALVSEVTEMTIAPKDIGTTYQNWIGRSVYDADPFLDAIVDDFRIYSGVLTTEEIEALAAQ